MGRQVGHKLCGRYTTIGGKDVSKLAVVGRSLPVVIWHVLSSPETHFEDLGADYYDRHVDTTAKKRNHVRQLEALGYRVTIEPAA